MQENNPKKSKAFIITFILILLLLVAGYYMFKNRDQVFGTKGSTTLSKIFSPLLGTSKSKDLTVIEDNTGSNTTNTTPRITGTVITDANGNKMVLAEAGEDLKKGDVLYISGFNANNNPIVKKAIANDKTKSLVFGVAGEDMKMGEKGNIIIEGVLSGVPTNRKEGTLWAAKNPLYLSDVTYGGMTKNPPKSPSFTVLVGSVITVDAVNGSILIGNISTNKNGSTSNSGGNNSNNNGGIGGNGSNNSTNTGINSDQLNNLKIFNTGLLNSSNKDMQGYWNSIFGDYTQTSGDFNTNGLNYDGTNYGEFPPLNPITPPDYNYPTGNLPSVKIMATPISVEKNSTSTITWTSQNTNSCTVSGGGISATGKSNTTGVKTKELSATTEITVTCMGTDKSSIGDNVIINVTGSNTSNLPTVTIKANPISVMSGDTSTITWTSTKTASCTVSGGDISATGKSNTTGVKTKSLTEPSTAITATCKGLDGSGVSDSVTVVSIKKIIVPTSDICTYPKLTDTDGSCINASACVSPKVISGNNCINGGNNNKCLDIEQNPLTFTPEEKARLAVLLRKFYLVSSTLKTTEDISTIYSSIDQQKNFINQIEDLTKQCYLETNDNSGFVDFCKRNPNLCNTNPAAEFATNANTKYSSTGNMKHGNPWFTKTAGGPYPYTNESYGYLNNNWIEGGCKYVSGFYYGILNKDVTTRSGSVLTVGPLTISDTRTTTILGREGESCDVFNTFSQYGQCYAGTAGKIEANDDSHQPIESILQAGCKWQDGVNLGDVEKVLNIW